MARTGTHHFMTKTLAFQYYQMDVEDKIESGAIVIGKPSCLPHQKVEYDADGRFWIVDLNPYICFYNSKRIELYAETTYQAQQAAAVTLKVPIKKQYLISVMKAEV